MRRTIINSAIGMRIFILITAIAALFVLANCKRKSTTSDLTTNQEMTYTAQCMQAMDLESLPIVSCNDFPQTIKIFRAASGFTALNPYDRSNATLGSRRCLNPDFAGTRQGCFRIGGTHGG
jgi:hypothetical protein